MMIEQIDKHSNIVLELRETLLISAIELLQLKFPFEIPFFISIQRLQLFIHIIFNMKLAIKL